MMVQGVRDVFEIVDLDPGGRRVRKGVEAKEEKQEGKLVLIGRGLREVAFGASLRGALGVA